VAGGGQQGLHRRPERGEIALGGGAKLALLGYLPVSEDPVQYSPTLAASLVIGLGP